MIQQPTIARPDRRQSPARGFTVVELLVVMMILGMLTAMGLSAYSTAIEQARVSRTKVIIAKLDQLIMEKWDSYKTRPLPIRIPVNATTSPRTAAQMRLNAIRDLMRMEIPERRSDVTDDPCDYDPTMATKNLPKPALWKGYRRKAEAACGSGWASDWSISVQGSECLYLIISSMRDGERNALEFFAPSEIGDVDGDGMKEILDGWGEPINFLRWAPGYTQENGALTMQSSDATQSHDPFDPFKIDSNAFALHPLIFSSGPDKEADVFSDNVPTGETAPGLMSAPIHHYVTGTTNNAPQPYTQFAGGAHAGKVMDRDNDGIHAYTDNITNHYQEAE